MDSRLAPRTARSDRRVSKARALRTLAEVAEGDVEALAAAMKELAALLPQRRQELVQPQ